MGIMEGLSLRDWSKILNGLHNYNDKRKPHTASTKLTTTIERSVGPNVDSGVPTAVLRVERYIGPTHKSYVQLK